ncbi:MAG: glucose 1-dehydrogenase [Bryobacterales bacterium]|nr:glucose 1-dehydrogenase [Bryobacterales bacterium]
MKRLDGKVAVVTGASLGIGAGIAERLASEGAAVVINYGRSKEAAEALVSRIQAAGGKAVAVQADIRDRGQVRNLIAAAVSTFGRLDVLVNNAGVYEFRPLAAVDDTHHDRQFDTNVKALLFATQEAVKVFGDNGGSIINISSVVGASPVANGSVYSATKAAVDAITKGLAMELGPRKIRVNAIAPGLVLTEGQDKMEGTMEFRQYVLSQTPLGRLGTPADIAGAVAFLASDDAEWTTGQVLAVAGGSRP